jgi:transcription elongation factor GreA
LDRIPITKQGYEALNAELKKLKSVDRPENIKAIATARAHGDLSENAEFDAAKEKQGFIQGRIGEIGYKLANADVIDPKTIKKDCVRFSCKVLIENIDSEEEIEYQIVGEDEANIDKGKISVSSPLGRALLGKKPGDEVVVEAPGGKRFYEVVEIL